MLVAACGDTAKFVKPYQVGLALHACSHTLQLHLSLQAPKN